MRLFKRLAGDTLVHAMPADRARMRCMTLNNVARRPGFRVHLLEDRMRYPAVTRQALC